MYLIRQFASLTGVTVRTLHHYDRLGLLSPTQRTESGYRLYTTEDLVRLERIMVLRYIGLSLRQIADILSDPRASEQDFATLLNTQAIILRERRDHITRVIQVVEKAEQSLDAKHSPDWQLFQTIVKEVSMQDSTEWSKKYYSEAAQQAVEQRKHEWSPELQEKVTAQWREMLAKVEGGVAKGLDPASPEAQQLAAQWQKLVEGFTAGNREVQKGLNAMYEDQPNWPQNSQQQYSIKPELMDFIRKAMSSRS